MKLLYWEQVRNISIENEVVSLLSELYTKRLPKSLRELSQEFWSAGQSLRKTLETVSTIETSLSADNHLILRKMEIIPSSASSWIVSPLAQRRTEIYRTVSSSFHAVKSLEPLFREADAALGSWARSLASYESPRDLPSDYRVGNSSSHRLVVSHYAVRPSLTPWPNILCSFSWAVLARSSRV